MPKTQKATLAIHLSPNEVLTLEMRQVMRSSWKLLTFLMAVGFGYLFFQGWKGALFALFLSLPKQKQTERKNQ